MLLIALSASSPPMALIPASNTSRALAYDFSVALSRGDCAKVFNDPYIQLITSLVSIVMSWRDYAVKVAIVAGHWRQIWDGWRG